MSDFITALTGNRKEPETHEIPWNIVMNGIYRNCRYNLPARYHISVVTQVVIWSEPEHDKTIKMTCVPSDSDQPEYPPSDQSAQYSVLYGKLMTQTFFMQTAKALIRLGGCPGWSKSSLGAQVILLVLSCSGSFHLSPRLKSDPEVNITV